MTRVKPKLYLNMSPETVEEGGLIFARNMKVDDDGHLTSDYGYRDLNLSQLSGKTIVGHIVGLDNKVYIFTKQNSTYNIFEYDEIKRTIVNTGVTKWHWSGGKITGYVSTNISGEKILTIAESGGSEDVPLKHINLSYYSVFDESIYTQAPKCPTANLRITTTYLKSIPNGVYVFFIRYKIRKDVYTNWFLCSRPVFAGTTETTTTLQGGLKYINTHKDSGKSFVFELSFIKDSQNYNANASLYKEFQLGFIITHDEATDARVWKHFNMPTSGNMNIYFDYDGVKDGDIDSLLETTYELYNVKNLTSFKNKLYISNYLETNFNPSLDNIDLDSLIDLKSTAIDTGTSGVGYSDVRIYYNNAWRELSDYVSKGDAGWYRKLDNTSISSLSYSAIKSLIDLDVSEFYKDITNEIEDVITLDLYGRSDADPDIIYVSGLTNDLYGHDIFGNNFTRNHNSNGDGWHDVGINVTPTSYTDIYSISNYTQRHPLYGVMSFGFGLFGQVPIPSEYSTYAEGNVIPINSNTISYGKAAAGASFMTQDIKSNISRLIKKELKNASRFIMGYGTITSGADTYYINPVSGVSKNVFDIDNYVGGNLTDYGIDNKNNSLDSSIVNALKDEVTRFVYDNIVGIDDNGSIVLHYDNKYIRINAIEFTFKACEFVVGDGEEINTNNDQIYNTRFNVTLKTAIYKCICNFGISDSNIDITLSNYSGDVYKQQSTLMPLSTYKAYIHFVDEHNIITNGYPLSDDIVVRSNSNNLTKYILSYKVNSLQGLSNIYKSFFISIKNIGDIIVETFGNIYSNGYNIVHCIEADALLYNINDNITLVDSNGSTIPSQAKYYPSGAAIPAIAFGNCGFIAWKSSTSYTGKVYVKIERTDDEIAENKNNLIKATPYIPLKTTSSYVDVVDGFYGSYFCSVKKPSFLLASSCYVSGNDIYSATRGTIVKLKEFEGFVNMQDSNLNFIRSNFNVNYLSLIEDLADHIHKTGTNSKAAKQVIKVINSAILSSIYELKSMYKDFMNKSFNGYERDYKIDFDNTIRVSNVLSDETFNNSVFKFEATNYYNVPTDRGVIVLLFSIGNNIFVHTKGSLYKFDANQTIMASESDITLKEAEPFDAGISQILDSQYGYGGIDNKEAGCITFDSYFFYDRFSTHIFAYGGNSQIQLIDASIYKLLKYYSPTYCATLHDDVNHRVLFNFKTEEGNTLKNLFTISYNYKAKSFVSIHDIDLTNSFAGRTRDFSYNGGSLFELFNTDTPISQAIVPESEGLNIYKLFGDASIASDLFIHDMQTSPFNVAIVMFPANTLRETINSIKYIGETITDYISTIENEDEENPLPTYDLIHIPKHNNVNPVKSLQIVTDTCVSNVINTTVDDTVRPDHTITDYKGFKHEIDSWNANYFRSILNSANIYNYDEEARELQPITPDLISDRNSLIYGKYYVLVFNFIKNVPIKFEEIFINSERY